MIPHVLNKINTGQDVTPDDCKPALISSPPGECQNTNLSTAACLSREASLSFGGEAEQVPPWNWDELAHCLLIVQ